MQRRAPDSVALSASAFQPAEDTFLYWLGNAGFLLNSRGTCLLADPVLLPGEMKSLISYPLDPAQVPHLEAVLVTHADEDHCQISTLKRIAETGAVVHTTEYVASLLQQQGIPSMGHRIGECFSVGNVSVELTAADHGWQELFPGRFAYTFGPEDCCGFLLTTPDGRVWAPGDSRLMDEHFRLPHPEAIWFDFSKDPYHFGFEDAVRLGNFYGDSDLLLYHWGSIDAPDSPPFNADPAWLEGKLQNPARVRLLAPGEAYRLRKKQ